MVTSDRQADRERKEETEREKGGQREQESCRVVGSAGGLGNKVYYLKLSEERNKCVS